MITKSYDLTIDIMDKSNNDVPKIEVVQGDFKTNILNISLVAEGTSVNVSNLTVSIAFKKQDGTVVLDTSGTDTMTITNASIGLIQCILRTQAIASVGDVIATVSLVDADNKKLTSTEFKFKVRESIDNGDAIESTNDIPILTQLISTTQNLENTIETAEAGRVTAENTRKNNENTRQTNEVGRVNAENTRVSQENSRKASETGRATAETSRVSAENDRVAAESNRMSAENTRVTNENQRIVNEQAGETEFNEWRNTIVDLDDATSVNGKTATGTLNTVEQTNLVTAINEINSKTGNVTSVAGKTGAVTLVKGDVGLGNVDNTSDANKPVSTAQAAAIGLKLDASQKGVANGVAQLDANGIVPAVNLPNNLKEIKVVTNIAARDALLVFEGLRVHVLDATADATVTSGWAEYLWTGSAWIKTAEKDSIDIILAWANIQDKPSFATVATSGSYIDLLNKPAIPTSLGIRGDAATMFRFEVRTDDPPFNAAEKGRAWYREDLDT